MSLTSCSSDRNYADFVVISKEIATLENEMLELKSVLEEWRAVPESLEGGWGDDDLLIGGNFVRFASRRALAKATDLSFSGAAGPNRRTQRNSLADLATLYKSQLSALWEGVEGAQKLLPYVPGRHIITESASFIELNSATYKPKQQVHLFLLNDAMLVSVKKRRGTGAGGAVRLVAERCFNLSEIVVVDLKDGGGESDVWFERESCILTIRSRSQISRTLSRLNEGKRRSFSGPTRQKTRKCCSSHSRRSQRS